MLRLVFRSLVDVHLLELSQPEVLGDPHLSYEAIAGPLFEGHLQHDSADDGVLFLQEAVEKLFSAARFLCDLTVHEFDYRQEGLKLVPG